LEELDQEIQRLVQERKAMESDIKTRRAALQEAKKKLQSVRAKKKKIDLPIFLKLRTY
jgi:chromosome segregation ATPase